MMKMQRLIGRESRVEMEDQMLAPYAMRSAGLSEG